MSITAIYVTKNGEHFLEDSMANVRPFVDEIILADNMSTDGTIKIAKKYCDHIIQKNYSKEYGVSKKINGMTEEPINIAQKNDCLQLAKNKWIMVIDDDEVYCASAMRFLKKYAIEHESGKELRWNFRHFWKDPSTIITGHAWNMKPQRFYFKEPGMFYNKREDAVQLANGEFLHSKGCEYTKEIKCFHYSYLKPQEFIKEKIKRYFLRSHPNVTEDNVHNYIERHPYFSGVFDISRYGDHGFFICGNHKGDKETTKPFPIYKHPVFMFEKFRKLGFTIPENLQ